MHKLSGSTINWETLDIWSLTTITTARKEFEESLKRCIESIWRLCTSSTIAKKCILISWTLKSFGKSKNSMSSGSISERKGKNSLQSSLESCSQFKKYQNNSRRCSLDATMKGLSNILKIMRILLKLSCWSEGMKKESKERKITKIYSSGKCINASRLSCKKAKYSWVLKIYALIWEKDSNKRSLKLHKVSQNMNWSKCSKPTSKNTIKESIIS